jgi:hypothetical protein
MIVRFGKQHKAYRETLPLVAVEFRQKVISLTEELIIGQKICFDQLSY